MSMLPDNIDAMLIRYFSGQLTESERIAFEVWIAEDPAREEEMRRLRGLWDASAAVFSQPDTEAALAQFKQRLRDRPPLTAHRSRRPAHVRLARSGPYAWRIA